LSTHEAKPLAEFEEEGLEAIDDGLLEILLAPVGALGEAEKLEDHRVLHDVDRALDLLDLLTCRSRSRVDQLARAGSSTARSLR
jgi:hypothetical protein